jgi:hypothetical protein
MTGSKTMIMPELKFKIAFNLGTSVYLSTDEDKTMGIIVAVKKNWNGGIYYEAKFNDESDWYQSIELELYTDEVDRKKGKKPKPEKGDDEEEGDGDIPK